ncbi:hypothetical protein [Heyndrickxia coagulans]|uniref:O-antigen polysaccharide polymerase Wzy n=1 Tax=Heyndrickxia coagulans TaxID=1398 RepID=A0AAW7C796_HEYCO|nr:hypothetical protein [Heyndrickxia coagulans]MDL5039747.1 hypothetical protein [Heyndrickxia coagulans]
MLNNIRVSYKNFLFLFISLIFWSVISFIYNCSIPTDNKLVTLAIIAIILNLILIIQTYNIPFMLIFSVFCFNYSYIFTIPAFFPTKISGVGSYNNNELLVSVLFQLMIGIFALNYLFFINKKRFIANKYLVDKIDSFTLPKNTMFCLVGIFGYLFFLLLDNSGKETNLPFSFTFEYIFAFVMIFKLFAENTFRIKLLIHVMLISICIKTLLSAGRIEVIESLSLLFIFYYEKKVKPIWILLGSFLVNILMEFIFIARNVNGDTSWKTSKIFFDRLNPPPLILGNEGDVTQASMAMTGVVQNNVVSFAERLKSFFDMIISQFIPLGHIESFHDSNVARYIQEFATTLGGGYIYSQWYFWLGISGVIVISLVINQIIKVAYFGEQGTIISITCTYSLILFSRWFAYFFDFLIKIPLMLLLFLVVFKIVYSSKYREVDTINLRKYN